MQKKRAIIVTLILTSAIAIGFALSDKSPFRNSLKWNEVTKLPEAKEEYKKLVDHYFNKDSIISLSGYIHLFDAAAPGIEKEKAGFSFYKKGLKFYSQLSYQKTWCDGSLIVLLDSFNRKLIVSKVTDTNLLKQAVLPFDKLFSDTAAFQITATVSEKNNLRQLQIKSDLNPQVNSYSIVYDPTTYDIKYSEITWWKSGTQLDSINNKNLWITRIDYQIGNRDIDINNAIKKLIVIKKDSIYPSADFKDYDFKIKR